MHCFNIDIHIVYLSCSSVFCLCLCSQCLPRMVLQSY